MQVWMLKPSGEFLGIKPPLVVLLRRRRRRKFWENTPLFGTPPLVVLLLATRGGVFQGIPLMPFDCVVQEPEKLSPSCGPKEVGVFP